MKPQLYLSVIVKVITALLLVWALDRHPYSYYILLRWLTCGAAIYVIYLAIGIDSVPWLIIFIVIALLFNPIIPVHLKRETWAIIDLGTATIFITSIFFVKPKIRSLE